MKSQPDHTTLIKSHQNPTVQLVRRLRRQRERKKEGLALIEGSREIWRALDASIDIEQVLYCESITRFERSRSLVERIKQEPKIQLLGCTPGVIEKITYAKNSEGVVAIASIPAGQDSVEIRKDGRYLVVDGIEKPGNLGAIVRTADAVAIDSVLMTSSKVDIWNPNAIRSSLGTIFNVPCFNYSVKELIAQLKAAGLQIIATSPSAQKWYTDVNLASNCAIVIGNEKDGLDQVWLKNADETVRLPSEGAADSINAAMAATVMLFESHRQRRSS